MNVHFAGHEPQVSDFVREFRVRLDDLSRIVHTMGAERAPVAASANNFKEQLEALYNERERLEKGLGTSDPDQVIGMVSSLRDQLHVLYSERLEQETGVDVAHLRGLLRQLESAGEKCFLELHGGSSAPAGWRIVCGNP